MDEVRLPDLEVIRRYSIAVRREHAPVEEVLEALRADLEAVAKARGRGARATPGRAVASSRTATAGKSSAARRAARPAAKAPARAKARNRTKR